MMGSMVLSKSDFYVIGGITSSTVDGENITKDVDYLMGFKFGIKKIYKNGLISEIVYTQRGFSESVDLYAIKLLLLLSNYVVYIVLL